MYKIKINIGLIAVFALSMQGCASLMPGSVLVERNGIEYSYKPSKGGTYKYANSKPLDLSNRTTETDKALAVFGFPSMRNFPPMTFTADMAWRSSFPEANERFLNGKYVKPESNDSIGLADGALTAGLAGDVAPLAAVGAVAALSGDNMAFRDARITYSHMLCFKPFASMTAIDALKSCWDDFEKNVSTAFEQLQPYSTNNDEHTYWIRIPEQGRAVIKVDHYLADYSPGYVPVQLGGGKAHVFKFYVDVLAYLNSNYKVEDLAAMLKKTKPDNLVYLITAQADPRQREGLEPIGVF